MKRVITLALVAALGLPATGGADNGKGKSKGQAVRVDRKAPDTRPGSNCPPGLAKKSPACIPPGQVKSRYRAGDRYQDGYSWITNPGRYGLKDGSYIRAGDYVYRVDRDTQKVLNLIGAVADILN